MTGDRSFAAEVRDLAPGRSPLLGTWLGLPGEHLLGLLADTSADYVGLDCQHGLLEEAEVARWLAKGPSSRAARLVRISRNDPALIGRVLDAGADGVIVPTVDDRAQAAAAVAAARFPPRGQRSYGPVAGYLPRDPEALGQRAVVLVMIETAAGLEAVEEIAAVAGVDGLYVGPADLGIGLGLGPGQFPPTTALEPALERIAAAARDAGVLAGVHAGSETFVPFYRELGFQLITVATERSVLTAGVARTLETARSCRDDTALVHHGAATPY